jgi:hypothetical protein
MLGVQQVSVQWVVMLLGVPQQQHTTTTHSFNRARSVDPAMLPASTYCCTKGVRTAHVNYIAAEVDETAMHAAMMRHPWMYDGS